MYVYSMHGEWVSRVLTSRVASRFSVPRAILPRGKPQYSYHHHRSSWCLRCRPIKTCQYAPRLLPPIMYNTYHHLEPDLGSYSFSVTWSLNAFFAQGQVSPFQATLILEATFTCLHSSHDFTSLSIHFHPDSRFGPPAAR